MATRVTSRSTNAATADNPAKFSDAVLDQIGQRMVSLMPPSPGPGPYVLDPFAGSGKGVDYLRRLGYKANGYELEPEWIKYPYTYVADCLQTLRTYSDGVVDAIVTSPCYGNRMADHHEAKDKSRRITYRHKLGRPLTDGSAAGMQWGDEYRRFHGEVWSECVRVLDHGGLFVLNCSDHIRGGIVQQVTLWHVKTLVSLGLTMVSWDEVETKRMGFGANAKVRVDHEDVVCLRKP